MGQVWGSLPAFAALVTSGRFEIHSHSLRDARTHSRQTKPHFAAVRQPRHLQRFNPTLHQGVMGTNSVDNYLERVYVRSRAYRFVL